MSSEFENISENLKEEIVKGKPLKIGNRTFYPVIEILTLEKDGKFWFKSVTPIAIAVLEPDNRYIIPLWDEDTEENESTETDDEIAENDESVETDDIWDELGIDNTSN